MLNLEKTAALMKRKAEDRDFDSYILYVKKGSEDKLIKSDNVNENTYFDIASLGKVLITAPLALQAIGRKLLTLDSTLGEFFADVPPEKEKITVKQILTHTSGIVRIPLSREAAAKGNDAVAKEILSAPLAFEPSTDYEYSCNGMILLGFIIEKIYGKPLETVFKENIASPLGYTRTKFNIAVDEPNSAVCYRSENVDGLSSPWDDENVRVLGKTAGSGGQFFSFSDLKKYADAVMEKDERLYPKELFDLAERKHSPDKASESRGLGWLYVDEKYHQTGNLFPNGSFGHCGHTGQSMFFNREKDLYVIILTNATRFLAMRSDFKYYHYSEICKMREELHDTIFEDINSIL